MHYTKINCLLGCDAIHSKAVALGNRTLKNNGINHDFTSQNIHRNRHRYRKSKPLASTPL